MKNTRRDYFNLIHIMSNLKAIQDYVFASKYARTVNGYKETWEQAVDRVMEMHRNHLEVRIGANMQTLKPYLKEAESRYKDQKVLGAQRALQWGGEQLLKHHFRLYNCSSTYINRVQVFSDSLYILLCGAGLGFSVQKHHVAQLPVVIGVFPTKNSKTHVIGDSIEGWSDAMKDLVESHFYGLNKPQFDGSKIRPKGSHISGGFKAPGPEPLLKALNLVDGILTTAKGRKLTPFEAHCILCIIADAVISGGVRRSALLSMFSADDEEMIRCKTGNWFYEKPYLGRSNNSAVILPDTPKDVYKNIFKYVKEFGEPGFIFLNDSEIALNPCVEIAMYPTWITKEGKKEYGFSVCNLTEINGRVVTTQEDFNIAARSGAILGTIQASYTDFPYLKDATEKIVRRDALIGVGITGMAENPHILFDPKGQREAAKIVIETNREVAEIIGINIAARTTAIKPAGTSSTLLGTSSGIHPFHAKRFIRHVQVNKEEQAGRYMKNHNPDAVTSSVWNKSDNIIAFPVDKSLNGVLTKNEVSAIELLDMVKLTQNNWILSGTNWDHPSYLISPQMTHNVSNTITVSSESEWEDVEKYLWKNREFFCGVSLLPSSGDLDYPQAPFTEVLDEVELAKLYGSASMLAGGLNVDGIRVFGDLWRAVDTALGRGEELKFSFQEVLNTLSKYYNESSNSVEYFIEGVLVTDVNAIIAYHQELIKQKKDWVRRFHKFSKKHLNGDNTVTANCLKQVSILHRWTELKSIRTINWSEVEFNDELTDAGSQTASACSGGTCLVEI